MEEARRKGRDPRREQRLRQAEDEAAAVYEEWKKAEEEQLALKWLAEASEKFAQATVEPRVEAEKLRFEEHKLRAALSYASIVGMAATVGLLPPPSTSYVPVLGVAFVLLFVSTVLALEALK